MHLDFTEFKDSYSAEELEHLVIALGFPKDVFKSNLPKHVLEDGRVLVKHFLEFCDLRYFHHDLHFTSNLKSAPYNVEVLKKSIPLVAIRILSFEDLQNVRLAFETYEKFDQRGMLVRVPVILKALKLCGRIVSPEKLTNKLRHIQSSYKEKGRIQLYEFLDLLPICDVHPDIAEDNLLAATDKTWRNVYPIDNFHQFVIPKDKKLWGILNEKYRNKELRFESPELVSEAFREQPLNSDEFHLQARLAQEAYLTTRKRLKASNRQIKLSKGGMTDVKPRRKTLASSTTSRSKTTKAPTTATTTESKWAEPRRGNSWHHHSQSATTITAVTTHRSAPALTTYTSDDVTKPKSRAQSCPPVVDDESRDELRKRLNFLRFQMCTEDERWSTYRQKKIEQYLSNHSEVLSRMKSKKSAPVAKKPRKVNRPESLPSRRLSEPGPRLPHYHAVHCDAICRGLGSDKHSMLLQLHGSRVHKNTKSDGNFSWLSFIERIPSSSRRSLRAVSSKNQPNFLESLLKNVEDICVGDNEGRLEKKVEKSEENAEVNPADASSVPTKSSDPENNLLQDPSPSLEDPEDANKKRTDKSDSDHMEAKKEFIREYFKPVDRVGEMLQLLQKDFSGVFLDPNSKVDVTQEETPPPSDHALVRTKNTSPVVVESRQPPDSDSDDSSVSMGDTTGIQNYFRNENQLRACLMENFVEGQKPKQRMRKSFGRLYKRQQSDLMYPTSFGSSSLSRNVIVQ